MNKLNHMWDAPNKPVCDPSFWRKRILWAAATGRGTHTAIYDIDKTVWDRIQIATATSLDGYLRPRDTVLDAGCGYGELVSCLPCPVQYTGVDCSTDLIDLSLLLHPKSSFIVADLRQLPFPDQAFRWSICRSMRKMVVDNLGAEEWGRIEKELLRVSRNVLILEYEDFCNNVEVL